MKKLALLTFPLLFLLFSCGQDDALPRIENTTRGKRWTLEIGSTPVEVYSQLKELGREKNFNAVNITYRKPFSKPEEVQNHLDFYDAITLQTKSGVTERAVIGFREDKISSIETGGALLDDVSQWPQNLPDEAAIRVDDPVEIMYEKLLAIYQIADYAGYQIILPDKTLEKPFDPDMGNYDVWGFAFTEHLGGNKYGNSSVSLFFKNKKLTEIRHVYNENETVN